MSEQCSSSSGMCGNRQTGRHADTQTDRQIDRLASRQTDSQPDRQVRNLCFDPKLAKHMIKFETVDLA